MSSWGTAVLVGLRSLVVVIAMAVVGLSAWSIHTIRDANTRGGNVLDTASFDANMRNKWEAFLGGVAQGQLQIWIAIGAGSFSLLTALYIFLSQKIDRLKASHYVAIPLDLLSMLAMAAAFVMSLTFTLKISPLCQGLDSSSSSDLASFNRLCPLSTSDTAVGGAGCAVLLLTSLASLISICHHSHQQKICSFEPTASTLGMGNEHARINPPRARDNIPTIYDPEKPAPGIVPRPVREEEIGLAASGAPMSHRDSGLSDTTIGQIEQDLISGPLSLENPETVRQMRPARPWSEVSKK